MPAQAAQPTGPSGAAITRHHGVTVLCSRNPHTVLILSDDQQLVQLVATTVDLM